MVQDAAIIAKENAWRPAFGRLFMAAQAQIVTQKDRAFLWIPVFYAIGIGVYFSLKSEPPVLGGIVASGLALSLLIFFWKLHEKSYAARAFVLLSAGMLLMSAGFLTAQIRTILIASPMLEKTIGPVSIEGTIVSIEGLGPGQGSRLVLSGLTIERLLPEQTPAKIRLSLRKDENIHPGDKVKLLARLNPPSPPVAPGAYDFQRHFYFKRIGGLGFSYSAAEILEEGSRGGLFENIRQGIIAQVEKHVPYPQAAVTITLLTGQKGAISDSDQDAMRASGLAHLLAISGLHVGMVAGVVFFFTRLLMALFAGFALKHPIKKYAAGFAITAAFFYMLVVGATIPTQRAMMMTGLVLVAIMLDRSPFSLRLVALAALSILIISPESLLSVSFQMSFAAVTALICFYDWLRPAWSGFYRRAGMVRRAFLYLAGVMLTTVIAGFATGLFALYHFQNFAVFGVVANMIAVPLMAFVIMPAAVLSYFLMPLGLDSLSFAVMDWGIGWVLGTAHWTAGLDGAVWHVPSWPSQVFIAMVFLTLLFLIWKGAGRYLALAGFFAVTMLIFVFKQPDMLVSSDLSLVSIRSDSGALTLSSGRKDGFSAESWLKMNGQESGDKTVWPKEGAREDFPLTCDAHGCRGELKGHRIAVAYDMEGWREDCNWAQLIISQQPVEKNNCRAPRVIDRFDVWREGAYAVWLTPDDIRIRSVHYARGNRPWTGTLKR